MRRVLLVLGLGLWACGPPERRADGGLADAGHRPPDAGAFDAGPPDAGEVDAGPADGGEGPFVPDSGFLVMDTLGGPVLQSAWLVTLEFPDVPDGAVALAAALPDSGWMHAVGDEYGVGLSGHSNCTVPFAAPAQFTDDDVAALVEAGLDAGWCIGPPDGGAAFWLALYPPTSFHQNGYYGGEHFEVPTGSGPRIVGWVSSAWDLPSQGVVPYQVIISHEVIEALTDPLVFSAPAFRSSGYGDPFTWLPGGGFNGGELADLCEFRDPVWEGPFAVTRSWSNRASAAGATPCVPVPPGEPWAALTGPLGAVVLSPGQSVEVDLGLVASAGVTRWPLEASGSVSDDNLQISSSSGEAVVGQRLWLTIFALPETAHQATGVVTVISHVDGGMDSVLPVQVRVR